VDLIEGVLVSLYVLGDSIKVSLITASYLSVLNHLHIARRVSVSVQDF
jgi:hypothetical protein